MQLHGGEQAIVDYIATDDYRSAAKTLRDGYAAQDADEIDAMYQRLGAALDPGELDALFDEFERGPFKPQDPSGSDVLSKHQAARARFKKRR